VKGKSKEIILIDFSKATPASALSLEPRKGKWRLIPWHMDARSGQEKPWPQPFWDYRFAKKRPERAGMMLWGYPDRLPPISFPLNVKGWHAISVGLLTPPWVSTRVLLRLSGEQNWNEVWTRKSLGYWFEEHFWRIVELDGQGLEIGSVEAWPKSADRNPCTDVKFAGNTNASLTFVRLVPLTPPQVRAIRQAPRIPCMRTIDGASFLYWADSSVPTRRLVTREIDAFQGSAFTDVSWGIGGGDVVNYKSTVGTLGRIPEAFPMTEPGWLNAGVNLRRILAQVDNPATWAADRARKTGMKFWIGHRIQTYMFEPPQDSTFFSDFCQDNPQWACRNRQGERLMCMSLAFGQVRRLLLDLFAECLYCRPHGIHLVLNRGVPYTYFERPVVAGFQRLHHRDIRTLRTTDRRVIAFRAGFMTRFLGELRAMLKKKGCPEVKIAANVFQDKAINDEYGLDVATWARAGLVDRLCPFRWEGLMDHKIDMDFWIRKVKRDTACEIFPFVAINHREVNTPIEDIRARALKLHRSGADGLCWWDAEPYAAATHWGNRAELEVWDGIKPLFLGPMHKVGPFLVDEMPPYNAF
jgi:hypothetical protein